MHRLLFIFLLPLSGVVLTAAAYQCWEGGGTLIGGGPQTPSSGSSYTVAKAFAKDKFWGDGTYGSYVTMTGHFQWSDGYRQVFPLNVAHVYLGERCSPPDASFITDYDQQTNFALYGSPSTRRVAGGYHVSELWDLWSCDVAGQQSLWWQWDWYWSASTPGDGRRERVCLGLRRLARRRLPVNGEGAHHDERDVARRGGVCFGPRRGDHLGQPAARWRR